MAEAPAKSTITADGTSPLQSYAVLAAGVMAVSLAAIFIRLAQDQAVPSMLIAGGRLIIAALLLTPAVLRREDYVTQIRQLNGRDLFLALVAGFFLAMHFASWVTSLEYTTVLISVVLVTTTPIWVALLEVFFLRSRLSQRVIIGLVIALAGGMIIGVSGAGDVVAGTEDQLLGALLSIIGALTVAVYLVIGRKLRADLALTPYIWLVYGFAAIVMSVIILLTGTPIIGHEINGYLWVLALALVPQLIGHSSLNYALAYLPATYVSLSTQMEPILSAIFAYFIFVEVPAEGQIAGGVMIMIGVAVASLRRKKSSDQA